MHSPSTIIYAVIPGLQRKALQEIIAVRRSIATELRKFLVGETPDRNKVTSLGQRYGELDGEVSWLYTVSFAKVNRTLSAEQRKALMKLRNLDGYTNAPYYIYSQTMSNTPVMPNTDPYFFPPKTERAP